MYRIMLVLLIGVAWASAAEQATKEEAWQSDFHQFLARIEQATDRASTDFDGVKKMFLDRPVKWKGTLKYFRKGRPYIRDSFVSAGKYTQMARVMYYADPDDAKAWEEVAGGATVEYSGVITDVKVMADPKKPFLFVDLSQVTLVK